MRATRYGRDKEYYARAAQETCLLAQIETRGGMANLDAICSKIGRASCRERVCHNV